MFDINFTESIIGFLCIILCVTILAYFYFTDLPNASDYKVIELPDILSSSECDTLVEFAKTKSFEKSSVLAYSSEQPTKLDNSFRQCEQTWIPSEEHAILQKLAKYSEEKTGIPIENQEMAQIAHYNVGGKFNPHFDACDAGDNQKEYCKNINRDGGERKATLLVYLNDDFQGGETEFINIGVKIKPKKGKGILFYNVDENEKIIKNSMHGGNEILSGEKWICTIWSHIKKYNK